ncbi:MAG: DUF2796 domain-containing protein [Pseudomonadota bacterium]
MRRTNSSIACLMGLALIGVVACGQNETPEPTTDVDLPPSELELADADEDHDHDHEGDDHDHEHDGVGEAHVHGKGEMAITLDGTTLTVSFESPLASFASFEHEPETPEQRQELQDVRAGFMRVSRNVAINGQAGCEFNTREVAFRHTGDHGSVMVDYGFECATPEELTSVRLRTFDEYPGLETVDVVFLSGDEQKAKTLDPQDNSIWLK